jgi:hypothetical protein
MSRSKKSPKNKKSSAPIILPPLSDAGDVKPFASAAKESRPLFSFRYISQSAFCPKKCSHEQLKSYADKLRILSDLEWSKIDSSPRELNGYELIPVKSLNGGASLPEIFAKHDSVCVFRFGGGGGVASKTSGRIAGIRQGEKFYVLFIDRNFALYDHG